MIYDTNTLSLDLYNSLDYLLILVLLIGFSPLFLILKWTGFSLCHSSSLVLALTSFISTCWKIYSAEITGRKNSDGLCIIIQETFQPNSISLSEWDSDRIKVLFSGDPSILSSGYQGMVSQITSELITAMQKLSQRSSPLRLQLLIIFMYKLSCWIHVLHQM